MSPVSIENQLHTTASMVTLLKKKKYASISPELIIIEQVIIKLMLNKLICKGNNHMVKFCFFFLTALILELNENSIW